MSNECLSENISCNAMIIDRLIINDIFQSKLIIECDHYLLIIFLVLYVSRNVTSVDIYTFNTNIF